MFEDKTENPGKYWISHKFYILTQIVKDYDPYLEMRWIPPDKRDTDFLREHPFAIVDTRTNYIVKAISEKDEPELILAQLFDMDNVKNDPFKKILSRNAAAEAFRYKQFLEGLQEAGEKATFFIKNAKSRVEVDGILYDDQARRIDGSRRSFR